MAYKICQTEKKSDGVKLKTMYKVLCDPKDFPIPDTL